MLVVSILSLGLQRGGRWGWRVDVRPGLVVGLTIPLVLAMTFMAMHLWGIGLHKISLGSLIIALFLRRAGFMVYFLGPNTPLPDLKSFVERQQARGLVLSAMQPISLETLPFGALRDLAPFVVVGGQAANRTPELVERLGVLYLGNDPRALGEALAAKLKEAGLW